MAHRPLTRSNSLLVEGWLLKGNGVFSLSERGIYGNHMECFSQRFNLLDNSIIFHNKQPIPPTFSPTIQKVPATFRVLNIKKAAEFTAALIRLYKDNIRLVALSLVLNNNGCTLRRNCICTKVDGVVVRVILIAVDWVLINRIPINRNLNCVGICWSG